MTPDQPRLNGCKRLAMWDGVVICGPAPQPNRPIGEMRAFMVEMRCLIEDPVTGSANALPGALIEANQLPDGRPDRTGYQVRQGNGLNRDGRRVSVRH